MLGGIVNLGLKFGKKALGSVFKGIGKVAGPLVTGGVSYAGQRETNAANAAEAERNRQFSASEAEKARQFTDEQSSTAVRRRVDDLEAAGLNPALAYTGGADTGSSPAGHGTPATFNSAAGAGISSGLSAFQFAQEVQDRQANRRLTNANAHKAEAEALVYNRTAHERELTTKAQLEDMLESIKERKARTRATSARALLDEFDAPRARNMRDMYNTPYGRNVTPYLSSAGQVISEAMQTLLLGRFIKGGLAGKGAKKLAPKTMKSSSFKQFHPELR